MVVANFATATCPSANFKFCQVLAAAISSWAAGIGRSSWAEAAAFIAAGIRGAQYGIYPISAAAICQKKIFLKKYISPLIIS